MGWKITKLFLVTIHSSRLIDSKDSTIKLLADEIKARFSFSIQDDRSAAFAIDIS